MMLGDERELLITAPVRGHGLVSNTDAQHKPTLEWGKSTRQRLHPQPWLRSPGSPGRDLACLPCRARMGSPPPRGHAGRLPIPGYFYGYAFQMRLQGPWFLPWRLAGDSLLCRLRGLRARRADGIPGGQGHMAGPG